MQSLKHNGTILAIALMFTGVYTTARGAGLQAELRSSSTLIPPGTAGAVAPTAPAGAVFGGAQLTNACHFDFHSGRQTF
jgi:hypothetical protein